MQAFRMSSLLELLFDGYWPKREPEEPTLVTIRGQQRVYGLHEFLAAGDVADVHFAIADADPSIGYLLKISRVPEGKSLLDNERQALRRLIVAAGDTTYRKYLPALVESLAATDRFPKRINVFRAMPRLVTLERVHEQHPTLDGRHLAWIFKRLLTVLGFSHRQGRVHGAVLPCHVLIHAAAHGLQLVGWGQSVELGQRIKIVPRTYQGWVPHEVLRHDPATSATDIFLAARCIVYLAGGDASLMPDVIPIPMQRFLASCLLESVRMRPNDAWELQEEFDALLQRLYGPPHFHELPLT